MDRDRKAHQWTDSGRIMKSESSKCEFEIEEGSETVKSIFEVSKIQCHLTSR